ncbi:sensor histidine kinase [Salinibacterium sp. G-O1]|uniref:sensor histidine kinase n=1 Tax=Salinibacterium sp. G-O1 TaxID=3046208 RepID=UPI0024BB0324|nr:sensor histidine kinase [Salinibacterium sp. G-O1]MDJ0336415.1 sensor histidine kinase [Salinibacterium sp. G-O1]
MIHTALTPVFIGLRTSLHVLVATLTALVAVRAIVLGLDTAVVIVALSVLLLATYALGGTVARLGRSGRKGHAWAWLVALCAEWLALVWLIPDAAYLVFPLFFLLLHVLPPLWGSVGVLAATSLAIVALGLHTGFTAGGVIGPLVGAAVAIVIARGYHALAREAAEREALMTELVATRSQLAATEHEAGVLAERARLAREIHDTVAQGLSSIQLLLHAAERAAPDAAGVEHIRLARETAGANLADTRRFIRELAPPALIEQGMGPALRRLADGQWLSEGLEVRVLVADALVLPMHIQTALLRIAQGAMANVLQHADAHTATISIELDSERVRLTVADDGRGFDTTAVATSTALGTSDSFGLTATRERVDQLGGVLTITSRPGGGTTLTVDLVVED